jgi:two-component system, NtrC family, nitrogen regulation sensor histidine kinase NtrY
MVTPIRHSLTGKVVAWAFLLVLIAIVSAIILQAALDSPWLAFVATAAVMAAVTAWSGSRLMRRTQRVVQALRDGIQSLCSNDFSVSITDRSHDELAEVVAQYNQLGSALRGERQNLYQRELLLDSVIQNTPQAVVLTNASGTVLYSNIAARHVFGEGEKLEGSNFGALLRRTPASLREAIDAADDSLCTLDMSGECEVYHVSKRHLLLNARAHHLYLFKQLTREFNAQEVATCKRVIRVIAHELNNSIGPISSLAHSGRLLAPPSASAQLDRIFATIEDRMQHLRSFIDGYARFAKLPKPRIAPVEWEDFIRSIRAAVPCELDRQLPGRPGIFDASQLAQALINVLKNAHEANSPPEHIAIAIESDDHGTQIEVRDRGCGMSEEVLENALLPFYSTKPAGTGLGLALCREIIEAHGGRMKLANREGGGLVVTLWLPRREGLEAQGEPVYTR